MTGNRNIFNDYYFFEKNVRKILFFHLPCYSKAEVIGETTASVQCAWPRPSLIGGHQHCMPLFYERNLRQLWAKNCSYLQVESNTTVNLILSFMFSGSTNRTYIFLFSFLCCNCYPPKPSLLFTFRILLTSPFFTKILLWIFLVTPTILHNFPNSLI